MSKKIVKGKKVRRKWMESEMIFKLFGMSENGKKDVYLLKWQNYPYLQLNTIFTI
jgi:hypothetical protein